MIDPEFIDSLRLFFQYAAHSDRFSAAAGSRMTRAAKMKNDMVKKRISDIGNEVDRTVSAIEKLPFVRFTAREHTDQKYFVGITKQIAVCIEFQNSEPSLVNLGQYIVYVPTASILKQSLNDYHFIRMKRPYDIERHYHHISSRPPSRRGKPNPLDHTPSTCWGSVGAMMIGAMNMLDIGSIFETAHVFLTHININDTLGSPKDIQVLKDEEFLALSGMSPIELFNIRDKHNPF